jgi:hypothetical protein
VEHAARVHASTRVLMPMRLAACGLALALALRALARQKCAAAAAASRVVPRVLALQAQQQSAATLEDVSPVRKFGLLAFWACFIGYATFLAPNVNPEASTALLPATNSQKSSAY